MCCLTADELIVLSYGHFQYGAGQSSDVIAGSREPLLLSSTMYPAFLGRKTFEAQEEQTGPGIAHRLYGVIA